MTRLKANWEYFEDECVEFLNKNYNSYGVQFIGAGGSDSTTSDIHVNTIDGETKFSIDCKMPLSQSGQFVLLIENDKFIFSPRNKSELDDFTKIIIHYMNDNFTKYKNVSTAGIEIKLPSSVFEGWIKTHYSKLNTKFIITCNSANEKIIFPLEKLSTYFTISAHFRFKKSGSSNLPAKDESIVTNFLKNEYASDFKNLSKENKKYLAYFNTPKFKKNFKFKIDNSNYQLAASNESANIITKLGTANNANVIFSLKFNDVFDCNDLQFFIDAISK